MKNIIVSLFLFLIFFNSVYAQESSNFDPDTVKAGRFDTGKMWTFDYPPVQYFEEEYGFKPDNAWFDKVRMAALRFATYCSASFVSADGLIMTNHHCARESVTDVMVEGEDLHANGFIASSLEEERPVSGLFVDQLVLIQDVTDEIKRAVKKGVTEDEKLAIKSRMFEEIEERIAEETGLDVSIVSLYEGARCSVYGYKRYSDVRLVFAPEEQLGSFGGDPDNFTYPRYNLDVSFFRVYDDDGKPLNTDYYFKWSENGPDPEEPMFVVGNPAGTTRLRTVAQLEYDRDVTYPRTLDFLNGMIETYQTIINNEPDRKAELEDNLLNFLNSQKAYIGILKGLRDPVLMQRKRDFENNFKSSIQSTEKLNEIYGDLWDKIESIQMEFRKISNKRYALRMRRSSAPEYFYIAEEVVEIANQLNLPEDKRDKSFTGKKQKHKIESLITEDFDYNFNNKLLKEKLRIISKYLGNDNELVQKLTDGKQGDEAVEYALSNSRISNPEDLQELIAEGPDAILNCDDPFIYFILNSQDVLNELDEKMSQLTELETKYNENIGVAFYEVYGASLPPEATFTLRLSDGVISGFPHNGTVAPAFTTYFGLYDRYYSFNKEYPWNLPERWQNPPTDFNLATIFNYSSTNDIIGGNSGSPVLNKEAEVVGVAFDGNIQGLPGSFIYRTEENRCINVHSVGMMEAFKKIYKAKRLADELEQGHIVD